MAFNIHDAISEILKQFYAMTDEILAKLTAPVDDVEKASNAKTLNGESVSALVKSINENVRDHIARKNNPHGLTARKLGGVTKSEADALNTTMSMGNFPVSFITASLNEAGSGETCDFLSTGSINPVISQFTYALERPWRACMAGVVVMHDTISIDFSKCPNFTQGNLHVYLMCKDGSIYFDVFKDYQAETMYCMRVGDVTISATGISNVHVYAVTRLGKYRITDGERLGSSIVSETSSSKLKNWSVK